MIGGPIRMRLFPMQRRSTQTRTFGRARQLATGLCIALLPLWWLPAASQETLIIAERVLVRLEEQHGTPAARRIGHWQQLIQDHQSLDDLQKLELVNDFFNRSRFVDDADLWGVQDYWATPLEFLVRDAGDCEDYAVAKYYTLRALGVDEQKLRITYVTALELDQAHMVLAYYATPTAVPLLLDNLNPRILPAPQRPDLQPVYSFNADDLWLARSRTEQLRTGRQHQLGPWQDILQRIQEMQQKLSGER